MKEIGGYFELDAIYKSSLREDGIALNCGRNAFAYLLKAQNVKKIFLPFFCCDCVADVCRRNNVDVEYYHIDSKFRPIFDRTPGADERFYIVNYYGQLENEEICRFRERFERIIVDNAQAYFQDPVPGVDTIYTCRKFFGVPDGAFLFTDRTLNEELPRDESFSRMHFVLGRFERTASEFYVEAATNNDFFTNEPIKTAAKLTLNLLRAIDYDAVRKRRTENFIYLHERLGERNKLCLAIPDGAFAYPFYCEKGKEIRRRLQAQKIYVPTLWADVFNVCRPNDLEYDYADNLLPLPCDQRYDENDMRYICDELRTSLTIF